jgi:molybdopterin-binding protein
MIRQDATTLSRKFIASADAISRSSSMKLSARNALPGIVRKIEPGAVNAEVTIELAPGLIVVSIITLDAVNGLQLKVGDRAYAVIKASSVMVAVD